MEDFFVSLIDFNESEVNYSLVFSVVTAYIILLWVAVCIWVFVDARKRYRNPLFHFLIFLFVLIFNIPALIFYLLIRPDFTYEEEELLEATLYNNRKLDPIIFSGDQGFDINLNIRVVPRAGKEGKHHEMDVDVAWVPTDSLPDAEHLQQYEQLADHVKETPAETEEEKTPEKIVSTDDSEKVSVPAERQAASVKRQFASTTASIRRSTISVKNGITERVRRMLESFQRPAATASDEPQADVVMEEEQTDEPYQQDGDSSKKKNTDQQKSKKRKKKKKKRKSRR